jgi:hypothetical protein
MDMRAFHRFSDDVSGMVGLVLLTIPTYFVAMSALRYDAPGLRFLGRPILILGTLALAVSVNAVSVLSVKLESEKPPVLRIALSLRAWNLAQIVFALLLLGALSTYLFVENFAPRARAD